MPSMPTERAAKALGLTSTGPSTPKTLKGDGHVVTSYALDIARKSRETGRVYVRSVGRGSKHDGNSATTKRHISAIHWALFDARYRFIKTVTCQDGSAWSVFAKELPPF